MYVEVYHRVGFWARITGAEGWRWRLVATRACFDGSPGDVRQSAGVLGGLGSAADRAHFSGGVGRRCPERGGRGPLTMSRPFNAMTATPGWAGHGHIAGIQ